MNSPVSLRALLPIISWLPRYERSWLRADVMAGLAVWAMMVPQALAYAGIAGVPPIYGLYCVPLAMVAYAFLGTSRTLSVGPESAIAIISAVTVGGIVAQNPGEYLALTSLLALIVGGLFLLFGLLRLGWVANFLSQPVLQGFTQGIALIVIIGQIPTLLGTGEAVARKLGELRNVPQLVGLNIDYAGFFLQVWAAVTTIGGANPATAAVGLASLVLLVAFKRLRPQAPSALMAVIFAVLAVSILGLIGRGVAVIGEVGTGMVSLALPVLTLDKVAALLPGALAIVMLGYSVSLSVAAVGAQATGEEIDPNQELVGLGVANLGAAVSSGFVVCGSLSRGVVIRRAGGRTQIVSLVNAGLVLLTLLFALPLFYRLPMATLAAIVITAMSGLLDFAYIRQLLRIDKGEFAYAMAALFGVLVLGILQGVALGVVLSLVVLIRRVSRPGTAVLGRVPKTGAYRDTMTHPEAETVPGMLIYRFDAPIIFPNAGYFAAEVRRRIEEATEPVRQVLIAAQQINQIDSTGADQLARLAAELEAKGIMVSFAEAKSALREVIRRTGLECQVSAEHFHESIEDGVKAFLERQQRSAGKVPMAGMWQRKRNQKHHEARRMTTTERSISPPDRLRFLSVLALIRTVYSSERSLMAWIRTSISLYTFGFSISTFIDYLESQESGTQFSAGLRRIGLALIAMGIVALVFAIVEHLKRIQIMERLGLPSTARFSLPAGAAIALLLTGVATLIGIWSA